MDITFSNVYVIFICRFHRNLAWSLRHCIGAHETVKTLWKLPKSLPQDRHFRRAETQDANVCNFDGVRAWASPGKRKARTINYLLQAELALIQVEEIGFIKQVGMTRQGQRRRTELFVPSDIFIVKRERWSLEHEMEIVRATKDEDKTKLTPSRGEGKGLMDVEPQEQEW